MGRHRYAALCRKQPECPAACGACRAEMFRIRRAHEGITHDEYMAYRGHCLETTTPMTRGGMRCYVHETLRRHNEPYEGDSSKLTVRMTREDIEATKAEAKAVGLSLQQFAFAALAIADPHAVADAWRSAMAESYEIGQVVRFGSGKESGPARTGPADGEQDARFLK